MNMYQVKILKTDNCGIIPRPPLTIMIKTTWKSMKAKISFNPVQGSDKLKLGGAGTGELGLIAHPRALIQSR